MPDNDLSREELHLCDPGEIVCDVAGQEWMKHSDNLWHQVEPSRYLLTDPVTTPEFWELYGPIRKTS